MILLFGVVNERQGFDSSSLESCLDPNLTSGLDFCPVLLGGKPPGDLPRDGDAAEDAHPLPRLGTGRTGLRTQSGKIIPQLSLARGVH